MIALLRKYNLLLIAAGLVLGLLVAGLSPRLTSILGVFGYIFLNALKFLVIPLIFLSVTVGIAGMGDLRNMGKIARVTIAYYLLTSVIAVVLGLVLVVSMRPGDGVPPPTEHYTREAKSALDFVDSMVPSNFFAALVETEAIPIILVAILFGVFLVRYRNEFPQVRAFVFRLNDAVLYLVRALMLFAPLGIMGLVAGILGSKGGWTEIGHALAGIGRYSLVVVAGLTIHSFIILPLILLALGRRSVIRYAYGVLSAILTAFATASSSATLPETIRCSEDNNKVTPSTVGFVLPLGATINMDGTALYEAVAVIFISQAYGIAMGPFELIVVATTATLASIGAAGIPEAGLVTMVLVLNAVGLPVEGIALILVIDWLLDRYRTAVNVWGDCVGAAVVDRRLEAASPTVS